MTFVSLLPDQCECQNLCKPLAFQDLKKKKELLVHSRFMGQMETGDRLTKIPNHCLSALVTWVVVGNRYLLLFNQVE